MGSNPVENQGGLHNKTFDQEIDDKFNFILDLFCDDFCEIDDDGYYVIKPEYRKAV